MVGFSAGDFDFGLKCVGVVYVPICVFSGCDFGGNLRFGFTG